MDRLARIQQVIADCRRRLEAGEDVQNEDVLAAHPDLMPELGEELGKLRVALQLPSTVLEEEGEDGAESGDVFAPRPECLSPTQIQALLADGLSSADRRRVEEHLAGCERCREEVADQREFEDLAACIRGQSPAPASRPEVPGYVLRDRLGAGGQGEVWLAHYPALNQLRALKVLRRDRFSEPALVN